MERRLPAAVTQGHVSTGPQEPLCHLLATAAGTHERTFRRLKLVDEKKIHTFSSFIKIWLFKCLNSVLLI